MDRLNFLNSLVGTAKMRG